MKNIERIDFLDVAKGIGIILVVAGHVIGEGGKAFRYSSFIRGCIYSFHMPLFFVISGILLGHSLSERTGDKEYYVKKVHSLISNLLIPYFIWSAIYFVFDNPFSFGGGKNIYESIMCMITFRGRAPIWFLASLFWAELAALIVLYTSKFKPKCMYISTLIAGILTIIASNVFDASSIDSILFQYIGISLFRGIFGFFFVMIGVIARQKILITEMKKSTTVFLILVSFLLNIFLFIEFGSGSNFHTFDFKNIYIFILSAISGTAFIILLSKLICKVLNMRFLAAFGKKSLGIMCLHYNHLPFMNYATEICNEFHLSGFSAFLVACVFVLCTSYVATEILQRYKIV